MNNTYNNQHLVYGMHEELDCDSRCLHNPRRANGHVSNVSTVEVILAHMQTHNSVSGPPGGLTVQICGTYRVFAFD